ncbi:rust resistance kinase Lr10 isoform X3 [Dendrobium catenatum]|uniref:rust resistance kinase Lr10 isoform X3 n=1 Tax=Dendrobium catenatum TaxID=906689 RepID=UPI0009F61902|nr:rust resistance kinase Lr10 isoform X3 [Dendrobium catenatum]
MPSSFKLFFFLIFLSYIEIILSHGRGSCSSSCGNLQNISLVFIDGQSTESYKEEMGITLYDLISPFRFEIDFLACLHKEQYKNSILTYYAAAVIFLVLDITLLILVLLIIGRFLFAPLCVLSFLAYNLFKLSVPVDIIERFLQNQKALSPSRYSYNDIITITSNFKEKLGQGGFGSVYKGRLPGGYLVAVKMLGKSMGDGEDFINEVSTIGRIHHVNVVQLVGFCAEGSYRALVYEYMANGSLDKYIFSSNKKNRILNMDKLLEIALSVAKGLHYLHQGCNMGILHFDIKPHNILLDHKFTPKISDFGLAKLHPKDHSLVFMSAARGTIGYIAPELISRSFGTISHKSDVYSFGMLLMDMAGGRRHNDLKAENSSQVYYPSWIYDKLQKTELSENFEIFEIDDLEMKLCKVGLCCIQTRPVDRPSMINVVEMLEADVNSLQMPPKPFFSSSHSMSQRNICMDYSVHELPIILENL